MAEDGRPITRDDIRAELNQMLDSRSGREASENRRRDQIRLMELRLVELIGTDGDSGEFAALVKKVDKMELRQDRQEEALKGLELFRQRAIWTIAGLSTLGGAIAGLTAIAIQWIRH